MKRRALILAAVLVAVSPSLGASGLPPLREVPRIDDGLLAVGIADEIRKRCDGIDARMFRALRTLSDLKSEARAMGYSDDQIEAYVTSKAEKARMKARGAAYLAAHGASLQDTESLCALGRDEIAKGSQIGALLKEK